MTTRVVGQDVHGPVARRLAALGVRDVLDLGGGTGTLATARTAAGVRAVVVASTSARTNDPELGAVLPGWGSPGTFDAEDAADVVGSVMVDVDVEHWDFPVVESPDREDVALFPRDRGLGGDEARQRAGSLTTPMSITKRRCLIWARGSRRRVVRRCPGPERGGAGRGCGGASRSGTHQYMDM